mgnify:CR=1 FL=1
MKEFQEYNPTARQLVSCLVSEYQWLNLLKNKEKGYEPILDYLINLGKEYEFEDSIFDWKKFQSKTIAENSGIKTSNLKKMLVNIYEDIFQLNHKSPELFKNGEMYFYELCFTNDKYTCNFNLWLPVLLSPLDLFDFHFVEAKMNISYFWVEGIAHYREYGKTKTTADLKSGFPNKYRELLLSKADFMKEISFDEKYNLSDYDLDKKLRKYAMRDKL